MPGITILIRVTPSLRFGVNEQTKLARVFREFATRYDCSPTDVVMAVKSGARTPPSVYTTEDDDMTIEEAGISDASHVEVLRRRDMVGRRVRKFFPRHGYFEGVVSKVDGPYMLVKYTDGDSEHMYAAEIFKYMKPVTVPRTRVGAKMARACK